MKIVKISFFFSSNREMNAQFNSFQLTRIQGQLFQLFSQVEKLANEVAKIESGGSGGGESEEIKEIKQNLQNLTDEFDEFKETISSESVKTKELILSPSGISAKDLKLVNSLGNVITPERGTNLGVYAGSRIMIIEHPDEETGSHVSLKLNSPVLSVANNSMANDCTIIEASTPESNAGFTLIYHAKVHEDYEHEEREPFIEFIELETGKKFIMNFE